jgi:hypothetical protein
MLTMESCLITKQRCITSTEAKRKTVGFLFEQGYTSPTPNLPNPAQAIGSGLILMTKFMFNRANGSLVHDVKEGTKLILVDSGLK